MKASGKTVCLRVSYRAYTVQRRESALRRHSLTIGVSQFPPHSRVSDYSHACIPARANIEIPVVVRVEYKRNDHDRPHAIYR